MSDKLRQCCRRIFPWFVDKPAGLWLEVGPKIVLSTAQRFHELIVPKVRICTKCLPLYFRLICKPLKLNNSRLGPIVAKSSIDRIIRWVLLGGFREKHWIGIYCRTHRSRHPDRKCVTNNHRQFAYYIRGHCERRSKHLCAGGPRDAAYPFERLGSYRGRRSAMLSDQFVRKWVLFRL